MNTKTKKAKSEAAEVAADTPKAETIIAYKGFDKDMKCRGFQFEVGKTYTHEGKVKACESGFHSCENPLDVFSYYDICSDNRFALVKASGEISRHSDDSKLASASLTVEAELRLPEFIATAIGWIKKLCEFSAGEIASGNYSQLAASGDSSIAACTGLHGKVKAGKLGAIALTRWIGSEKRYRISVGYVGENGIKPDVWYSLNEDGEFVEVAE